MVFKKIRQSFRKNKKQEPVKEVEPKKEEVVEEQAPVPPAPTPEEKPSSPEPLDQQHASQEDTEKSDTDDNASHEGDKDEEVPEGLTDCETQEQMEATEKKAQSDSLTCCGLTIPVE